MKKALLLVLLLGSGLRLSAATEEELLAQAERHYRSGNYVLALEGYNELLGRVVSEAHGVGNDSDGKPRVLLAGGICDSPEFVELVEESGGAVVAVSTHQSSPRLPSSPRASPG